MSRKISKLCGVSTWCLLVGFISFIGFWISWLVFAPPRGAGYGPAGDLQPCVLLCPSRRVQGISFIPGASFAFRSAWRLFPSSLVAVCCVYLSAKLLAARKLSEAQGAADVV